MKSINLKSENFRQNLYSLIGTSELPIANVYFILKMAMQQVENTYYGTLNTQSSRQTEEKEVKNIEINNEEKNE